VLEQVKANSLRQKLLPVSHLLLLMVVCPNPAVVAVGGDSDSAASAAAEGGADGADGADGWGVDSL
jgi:hypothetical protein